MLFHFLFLALVLSSSSSAAAAGGGVVSSPLTSLPSDAISLLSFKSHSDLDSKLLYNTNEHFDYCQWHGVKCAQGRVVRYSVQSFGLRGTLPDNTLTNLVQLRVLSLKNNSLTGPLPNFSNLINLRTLTLDHNHFTGNFPLTLLPLTKILILDLSFNNFTGVLPENLTALDRLGYLRLDSNKFYGAIPQLNQTMLEFFNVSWNNLSGAVPVTPTMKKFQSFSFLGNPGLCGEVINRPCRGLPFFGVAAPPEEMVGNADSQEGLSIVSPPGGGERKHHNKKVGVILGFVIGALIVTAGVLSLVAIVRKKNEEKEVEEDETEFSNESNANNVKAVMRESNVISVGADTANAEPHEAKKVKSPVAKRIVKSGSLIFCSGEEESYSLEQLMRGSAELLGRGTIGTTYKAVMSNQVVVSVKRLDACKTAITSGEAFEQHMEAVGVLRHPNLVPVRAYFQAKQERLIIFDYQHNGSLFNLIHGSRSSRAKPLHWTSCLKIAEDVAQGLAYIHQASNFIHGNLKSSNVLLGSDFEACVTDYCLTTLADTSSEDEDPNFSAYKAPEIRNSTRRATAKSDVYAFGVLLLELLTGKPPSQHPFLAPPDMPDWVRAMREDDSEEDTRLRMLVEVASICSLTSPEQRPTMWHVLKMITNVKEIMDDSSRNVHDGYS